MIESIRYSAHGHRATLEKLADVAEIKLTIHEYPARSATCFTLTSDSKAAKKVESFLNDNDLDIGRHSSYRSSPEEIDNSCLFKNAGCYWLDDMYEVMNKPDYTDVEACKHCGKGSLETHSPLRGKLSKLGKADLIRLPPGLVIISKRIRDLFDEHQWTGATFRPVIDSATDQESSEFFQLWITSTLPPMHATAPIEHNGTPDACVYCKRYGYMLGKPQPIYANKVLEVVEDWNFSQEWLAGHAVSVPSLICTQRVVKEIMKLKSETIWLPCLLT